jgi:hypothetical protein
VARRDKITCEASQECEVDLRDLLYGTRYLIKCRAQSKNSGRSVDYAPGQGLGGKNLGERVTAMFMISSDL